MNTIKHLLYCCAFILLTTSCGIMGIHFNVHNPKPGKYPKFTPEVIQLGELTPIRESFDVNFYDLDIWFNPEEKTLGGWVETRVTALKNLDSIQLDLDDNLIVDELRLGNRTGQSLNYSRKYRGIFIALPKRVDKGEQFSVFVKYHGEPTVARRPPWAGGTVWKKDDSGKYWLGVACETEGASVWFPCKDHTSDEPDSVALHYTINDPNLAVIGNGQLSGVDRTAGSATWNWKVTYPINLYNITYYMGDFVKVEDSYTGISGKQLNITHYVLRPNETLARSHFQQVKKQIRIYEEVYGEYPWYRDGFKLVESPYEGMEHQTAIAYGNGFRNGANGIDYIILHETGHEWFGNAITAADLADVWIQEGITTYGESLYFEKAEGRRSATNHLLSYRFFIRNKRPLVGPVGRRYFDYKDSDVYTKGAWTLHSLRTVINNDSVFFKILSTFYNENAGKVTGSAKFIETTNRITGKDFTWFFTQYLYRSKVPFIQYNIEDGVLYYRWADVGEDFDKMPVTVRPTTDGKAITLYPNIRTQSIKLEGTLLEKPDFDDELALYGKKRKKRLK